MSNVRLGDAFQKSIDDIIRMHKSHTQGGVIKASDVLKCLLQSFIKKHDGKGVILDYSCLFGSTRSFHSISSCIVLAKVLLGFLNPHEYKANLDPILKSEYKGNTFFTVKREQDDVACFTGHLNRFSEKINADSELAKCLSAFFSIYPLYRNKLNADLQVKLSTQNIWIDDISLRIQNILDNAAYLDVQFMYPIINILASLSSWIPPERRESVSKYVISFLNQLTTPMAILVLERSVARSIAQNVLSLSMWMSEKEKDSIVITLISLMGHAREDIRYLACFTLIKFKVKLLSDNFQFALQEKLEKLISLSAGKEEIKMACQVIRITREIVPSVLWPMVVNWLQSNLSHHDASIRKIATNMLKHISMNISDEKRSSIIQSLIDNLSCNKKRVDILSVEMLLLLKPRMLENECLLTTTQLFYILLSTDSSLELKLAVLNVIYYFRDTISVRQYEIITNELKKILRHETPSSKLLLSGFMYDMKSENSKLFSSLIQTIESNTEEIAAKIAALETISIANFAAPNSVCYQITNSVCQVINDKAQNFDCRRMAVEALGYLAEKIPYSMMENILIDLLAICHDESEEIRIRMEVVNQIANLKALIPSNTRILIVDTLKGMINNANVEFNLRLIACDALCHLIHIIPTTQQIKMLSHTMKALLDELLVQLNMPDSISCKNACELIGRLRSAFSLNDNVYVINALIMKINDHDETVRMAIYKLLNGYVTCMNSDQKIAILCHVRSFSLYEDESKILSVILMSTIYNSFRREHACSVLSAVVSDEGHSLPEEIIQHINHLVI